MLLSAFCYRRAPIFAACLKGALGAWAGILQPHNSTDVGSKLGGVGVLVCRLARVVLVPAPPALASAFGVEGISKSDVVPSAELSCIITINITGRINSNYLKWQGRDTFRFSIPSKITKADEY
jgi:hypothetical protein